MDSRGRYTRRTQRVAERTRDVLRGKHNASFTVNEAVFIALSNWLRENDPEWSADDVRYQDKAE